MAQALAPMSEKFEEWYQVNGKDSSVNLARKTFEEALDRFSSNLTNDPRKQGLAKNINSMEQFRSVVSEAEKRYRESDTRVGKWLRKLSQRVHYYGNIMDVLVQHHPEYTSLAWGAMKFLFTAVVNNEALLATISKSLSKIADLLPRTDLASELYPTKRMLSAVSDLYAHIIRFLIRAQDWFQESKFSRTLHSIMRPAELRYADLLQEIEIRSQNITALAEAASQAEIRSMRLEILEMRSDQKESAKIINELKQIVIQNHVETLGHQMDTNHRLSDLQLSQILALLESPRFSDPTKALQLGLRARNHHSRSANTSLEPFWTNTAFQKWAHATHSSLIIIKGAFRLRPELRDLGVNLVHLAATSSVPILWVLRASLESAVDLTAMDMLRFLVYQAMKATAGKQTERSMALGSARFHSARTEEDWFELLASVIADLELVYIVIDTELITPDLAPLSGDFSFLRQFFRVFEQLKGRGLKTKVKVLLMSYETMAFCQGEEGDGIDTVISVRKAERAGRFRKGVGLKGKRGQTGIALRTSSKRLV